MPDIIKKIDDWKTQKKKKQTKIKRIKWDGIYSKRVRPKWICWASKKGFIQLICKTSLMFFNFFFFNFFSLNGI